jgi:predicted kinase
MQQLVITVGLPASGKSTFSRNWVNEAPKTRIRVCRDDIRRMLGPYWVPTREDLVTSIERETVRTALMQGFSVVLDATNFQCDWAEKMLKNMMTTKAEIKIEDFTHVSLEECIARDAFRDKSEQVGEEVIRRFHEKYIKK